MIEQLQSIYPNDLEPGHMITEVDGVKLDTPVMATSVARKTRGGWAFDTTDGTYGVEQDAYLVVEATKVDLSGRCPDD